jgi:hypothetical protein
MHAILLITENEGDGISRQEVGRGHVEWEPAMLACSIAGPEGDIFKVELLGLCFLGACRTGVFANAEQEKKAMVMRSAMAWSSGDSKVPYMAAMLEKKSAKGSAIMGWGTR